MFSVKTASHSAKFFAKINTSSLNNSHAKTTPRGQNHFRHHSTHHTLCSTTGAPCAIMAGNESAQGQSSAKAAWGLLHSRSEEHIFVSSG
jgi:hypothetical protein